MQIRGSKLRLNMASGTLIMKGGSPDKSPSLVLDSHVMRK
jgi:hypothetical protein